MQEETPKFFGPVSMLKKALTEHADKLFILPLFGKMLDRDGSKITFFAPEKLRDMVDNDKKSQDVYYVIRLPYEVANKIKIDVGISKHYIQPDESLGPDIDK